MSQVYLLVGITYLCHVGGGFHHCSSNEGGGFCAYADITLSIMVHNTSLSLVYPLSSTFISLQFMLNHLEDVRKVMIVDLDAHQGNGHENDFMHDSHVYIVDVYNKWIYPNDTQAKGGCGMF